MELHYICPIANLASVLAHGLLSHRRAQRYRPVSVALGGVQAIRENHTVPQGLPLHEYVNLYFHARNPMMYKIQEKHAELVVFRVNPAVLDIPGAVVADGNAARRFETAFWSPDEGIERLSRDLVYAEWWVGNTGISDAEGRRIRCAEVLVPDRVGVEYLLGLYASCRPAQERVRLTGCELPVTISEHMFFRVPG